MRVFSLLFKLLLITLVLAAVAAAVLMTQVNPNKFKPMLETQLSELSGRKITIHGDMEWQFMPHLAIKAHQVEIGNAPGFQAPLFAVVDAMTLKVATKPLLKKNIVIPEVTISQAKVNLEINANLSNNWSDFAKEKTVSATRTPSRFKINAIDVHRLSIVDSAVTLQNRSTNQTLDISRLNITSRDLKNQSEFPLSLQFRFAGKDPKANKTVFFGGDADLDGKVRVDLAQWERSKNLVSALTFTGNATVTNLIFDKLKLAKISTPVTIQSSLISLHSIKANLYGGSATGKIALNMQQTAPGYRLEGNLSRMNASQFFKEILNSNRITGTADFTLALNASGKTASDLTRSLNGTAKFSFQNGELVDIDIPYLVDMSIAVFNKKDYSKSSNGNTPFGSISGSMTIRNGEITNPDFKVVSNKFNVDGAGTVNLNSHQVRYRLNAKINGLDETGIIGKIQKELGGAFPINVTGTWENLSATPDIPAIVAARAKLLIKDNLDKVINKKLGTDLLGTPANDAGTVTPNGKPADKAKDLIKKILPF